MTSKPTISVSLYWPLSDLIDVFEDLENDGYNIYEMSGYIMWDFVHMYDKVIEGEC
jgi:hypothetical protein